jgi:hypothetical protein
VFPKKTWLESWRQIGFSASHWGLLEIALEVHVSSWFVDMYPEIHWLTLIFPPFKLRKVGSDTTI